MKRICMNCGRRFDTGEVTGEQLALYGKTMCRECWRERSHILLFG